MRLERADLARELAALDAAQQRRQRRIIEPGPQPAEPTRVRIDGRELLNFSGNDYLGLRTHPALIASAQQAMGRFGLGAGAAHLITGHSREHHALEEELADFTGRERALLFSTGYMANLGVVASLAGRHDTVLADRLNHASLVDAVRLAGARLKRYAHADAAAAERALGGGARLIVTDGVFSMDGDVAPLRQLAALAQQHGAWLIVDDAHGLGVLGTHGGGSLEEAGLDARQVPILVGTLGKAFGTFGAFAAGDAVLIEYLLQRARTYIYTTAVPAAVAAATRAALQLVRAEPWRRERLHALIARFRAAAAALALPLLPSATPIQPLLQGDAAEALRTAAQLEEQGFLVSAIRPPSVPRGTARLRITLCAAHRDEDVDALAAALAALQAQRRAA
ncbi:MAG TPA: 8-amino-7-oxononanoate synthase [Steroidobacteraceae bacterium]|nr:8-amino-7-oxononanoate synthase [Steroidobacteraceae bacterium]